MGMTKNEAYDAQAALTKGDTITLVEPAPVSSKFIGRTGRITGVLPNAFIIVFDDGDSSFIHRTWSRGGILRFEKV